MIYIYSLSDPRTNAIRYIGKTINPKHRKHSHNNKARDKGTYKRNWINQLQSLGLRPVFEILDVVEDDWQFWESYWIFQCKSWGFRLTNSTIGGEGLNTANNTTFKSGLIPWNAGTGHKSVCSVCNIEFASSPANQRKFCSRKCSILGKSKSSTVFSKGIVPWNLGKIGYSTSKKGTKITDIAHLKKLREVAIGNTYCRKTVYQYDLKMNLITTFKSVTQAIKITGIKGIRNCVTHRSKTSGGFIWHY